MVRGLRRSAALTIIVSLLMVSLGPVCMAAGVAGPDAHQCCPVSIQAVEHCHQGQSIPTSCCLVRTPAPPAPLPTGSSLTTTAPILVLADVPWATPQEPFGRHRSAPPPPVSPPALSALRTTVLLI